MENRAKFLVNMYLYLLTCWQWTIYKYVAALRRLFNWLTCCDLGLSRPGWTSKYGNAKCKPAIKPFVERNYLY